MTKEVDTFIYLGSGVGTIGGTKEDIKATLGKARGASYSSHSFNG